jgi:hypothetical protein
MASSNRSVFIPAAPEPHDTQLSFLATCEHSPEVLSLSSAEVQNLGTNGIVVTIASRDQLLHCHLQRAKSENPKPDVISALSLDSGFDLQSAPVSQTGAALSTRANQAR